MSKNDVLPEIMATQLISTAQSGANRPLFIRGIDINTSIEGDYVLKYRGIERMNETRSARELLAAYMAMTLGIPVPAPVTILVTESFLKLLKNHPDFEYIQKSKGINFGSVKMTPNHTIIQDQPLTPKQMQQALQIFVFDIWIHNSDRRFEKPNMFLNNDNIHVIDHELAFGFLDLFTFSFLGNATPPFLLSSLEVNAAKKHFFYRTLQRVNQTDLDIVFQPYSLLDDAFWQRVRSLIPKQWQQSNEIEKIQAHFNQIIHHSETYKKEIWTKLLA